MLLSDTPSSIFSSDEPVLTAIFVCSHCHRLTLLPHTVWVHGTTDNPQAARPAVRRSDGPSKKNSYLIQPLDRFRYRSNFNVLSGDFTTRRWNEFPICSECVSVVEQRLKFERSYVEDQVRYLSMVAVDEHKRRYDAFPQLISRVRSDASTFLEVTRQYTADIERCSTPELSAPKPRPDDPASSKAPVSRFRRALPTDSGSQFGFSSLTLASAFRIGTNRHYATINDCRLGTNTPDPVPPEELEHSLFYTCQLIQAIGAFVSVDTTVLVIGCPLSFADKGSEKGAVLIVSDLKSRRGVQGFQAFINRMVGLCQAVFKGDKFSDSGFSPPHVIDLGRGTISDDSFVWDPKKPAVFTSAMKHFMFNLKYVQRRALLTAVRELEPA
jgi:hypothetical protein